MQYKDLNGHFRERIRARVQEKLQKAKPATGGRVDPTIRDYLVGVIILSADENNLVRAAERLYEMEQTNPATAGSYEDALFTVTEISSQFRTEVSILVDLYQMQVNHEDIKDIIAHTELRLLEPIESEDAVRIVGEGGYGAETPLSAQLASSDSATILNRDALLNDVKDLLRRSIASTLKIGKAHYDMSLDAQTAVDRCLSMVMAIGYNETLEGALDDLCEMGSFLNTNKISRDKVQKEVMGSLNTFRFEIAMFKRMHEMGKHNMEPKAIWKELIAKIHIAPEYHDDWLANRNATYR
jgi:hypothetical protein